MPFTLKERQIYEYTDGSKDADGNYKKILADPLVIQRRMLQFKDFDLGTDLKLLGLANDESLNAFERLVKAGRHAFNVKTFDEGGLLDNEVCELIADFGFYMTNLKKSTEPTVLPPPNTDQIS
jgi:hypothetical protein